MPAGAFLLCKLRSASRLPRCTTASLSFEVQRDLSMCSLYPDPDSTFLGVITSTSQMQCMIKKRIGKIGKKTWPRGTSIDFSSVSHKMVGLEGGSAQRG